MFLGPGLAQTTLSGKLTRSTHGTYCSRTGGRIRGHCSCLLIGTNVHVVRHGETLAIEHNLDEQAKAALFENHGQERNRGRRVAMYNQGMVKRVIHISDAEAASDFAALLDRVRTGAEIVIEHDARPVAVLHAAEPVRRTISECIALLPADSTATIDPDFAKDVEAAVESHREPLSPPAWD